MIFTNEIIVEEIDHCGGDDMIASAALVLRAGEELPSGKADTLIPYLMKHRHGTPFEQSFLNCFVEAPIFVFREWHRHRIGFSYNETSARYKSMKPMFFIPEPNRPMKPVDNWKPSRPKFDLIGSNDYDNFVAESRLAYRQAWESYERILGYGVALEVARMVLPVGIYSSMRCCMNPRSLMAFLSLRIHAPDTSFFVSYPQYEIQVAAEMLDGILKKYWPITYAAFVQNGRVAP